MAKTTKRKTAARKAPAPETTAPTTARKPLLSKTEVRRFEKLARDEGPQTAYRAASYQAALNSVVRRFSVDAIQTTRHRRRPEARVGSVDEQFKGTWDRNKMIATARDLVQNFSLARGLINVDTNNVVGTGPVMQVRTKDSAWNARKEAFFHKWARNCDIRGVLSWGFFVRMIQRRTVVDGDLGVIMTDTKRLQGIEGDRIANPPGKKRHASKNRRFVHGVEVDKVLTPLAYHIWRRGNTHNPDLYEDSIDRTNFIHSFDPDRFDQTRGMSHIISAMNDLQDAREVLTAIKGSMKLENMLGVVWQTNLPQSGTLDPLGILTDYTGVQADGTRATKKEVAIEQGTWSVSLEPGEEVKTVQKSTPGNNFDPWMLFQIRLAGLALDMPLEIAFMYFTRGSFSSLKGAVGQYHHGVKVKRARLEVQFCDRVAAWVIEGGLKRWRNGDRSDKALEPPENEDIDTRLHTWQWPMLPLLEPNKQIDAETKKYKMRTTTLTAICAASNEDFEQVVRQQARELQYIGEVEQEFGLAAGTLAPQVTKPGESTGGGPGQGEVENSQEGDEEE